MLFTGRTNNRSKVHSIVLEIPRLAGLIGLYNSAAHSHLAASLKTNPLKVTSRHCVDGSQEVLEERHIVTREFGEIVDVNIRGIKGVCDSTTDRRNASNDFVNRIQKVDGDEFHTGILPIGFQRTS